MADEDEVMLTELEWSFLQAAVVITSTLSIIGCALIFVSYAAWRDIRTVSRKLLVYLSLCDFVTALFNIVGVMSRLDQLEDRGDHAPTALCVTQSFFNSYSSIASFLWTVSIGLYLFLTLVLRDVALANKAVLPMHVVCWGCPAICIGTAAGLGKLGYDMTLTPGWCWLRPGAGRVWVLVGGKAWEMFSYILTPLLYVLIKRAMARESQEHVLLLTQRAREAGGEADRKLAFVPLVFVLLRVWGTVRTLMDLAGASSNYYGLILLQAIGDCGQGFANGILFCFLTKRVRDHFLTLLKRAPVLETINDTRRLSHANSKM